MSSTIYYIFFKPWREFQPESVLGVDHAFLQAEKERDGQYDARQHERKRDGQRYAQRAAIPVSFWHIS
jgi:hypothetical protein